VAQLPLRDPLRFLTETCRDGDATFSSYGRQQLLVVNHPDLIQELLVVKHKSFVKENTISTSGEPGPRRDGGLLQSDDWERHLVGRRILQPAFKGARLESSAAALETVTEAVTQRWREGEVIDVMREMRLLSTAAVAHVVFDAELDLVALEQAADDVGALMSPFALFTSKRHLLRSFLTRPRRLLAAPQALGRIEERMARYLANSHSEGGVAELLRAAERDGVTKPEKALRDAAVTFIAGVDTTATALTWLWHRLAGDEEAARLYAAATSEDSRAEDGYLRAAFSETLRLYPPSWFIARRALREQSIARRQVAGGGVVICSPYVTHRDPRWWPTPDGFAPERWVERAPGQERLTYFPFGAGPRRCLGEPLAWLEGTVAVAAIAREWRLRSLDDGRVPPEAAASLRPARQLRMRLERR
jgi:cytochrome P450